MKSIYFILLPFLITSCRSIPIVTFHPASCTVNIGNEGWVFNEITLYDPSGIQDSSIWIAPDNVEVDELRICEFSELYGIEESKLPRSLEFWISRHGHTRESWIKMHLEISESIWEEDSVPLVPIGW